MSWNGNVSSGTTRPPPPAADGRSLEVIRLPLHARLWLGPRSWVNATRVVNAWRVPGSAPTPIAPRCPGRPRSGAGRPLGSVCSVRNQHEAGTVGLVHRDAARLLDAGGDQPRLERSVALALDALGERAAGRGRLGEYDLLPAGGEAHHSLLVVLLKHGAARLV